MSLRIEVNNIDFSYIEGEQVLSGVSLEFSPGSTAIIGQNGAGKSTLMKLLNGLLKPTSGDVLVGDLNTKNNDVADIAHYVSIVFQNPDDQIFKQKVLDEVMFGPINIGMNLEEARSAAIHALARVGLSDAIENNPYDLSYAGRKRVCIASILAMNTDVIIFDEPTIGADFEGVRLIGEMIRDLVQKEKTVIAIVHDMNFAAKYFDRIVMMAKGRVICDGLPSDVFIDQRRLELANVDAPTLVALGQRIGLKQVCLNVDDFVLAFQQEKQNTGL